MTMAFPSIKQLESSSSTWDRGGLNSHFYRQVSLYSRALLFLSFFLSRVLLRPRCLISLRIFPEITSHHFNKLFKQLRRGGGFLTALDGNGLGSRKDDIAFSTAHTYCRMLAVWEDPWRHRCADRKYCMPQGPLELYIAVYTDSISKCLYRGILLHILQFHVYWTHLNQPIPM